MPDFHLRLQPSKRKEGALKARWTYLLALLVLAAGTAFAVLSGPAFYAAVIDPVARIFWLLIRTLGTVDQEVYWILLIFAGFVLVALLVPGRKEELPRAYNSARRVPEDRIAYWKTLLDSAQTDPNARLALERDLADLRKSAASVADIPKLDRPSLPSAKRTGRLSGLLRLKNSRSQPDLLETTVQIIHSLETALEIDHDSSNSNPSR